MVATLKDLYRELWLRLREQGKLVWVTKDGKKVPIKDMSDTHLVNTIKMLERSDYTDYSDAEIGDFDPTELYD